MSFSMSSNSLSRVLVVGGGIGGLAAAIALRRAGCEVELVEAKTDWQQSGVGIIQPGNALRALDSLGLAQACLAAGFAYEGYDYFDAAGTLIHAMPSPRVAPHLPAHNGILRSRLHEILLGGARASGADLRAGSTWASFEEAADGMHVQFIDGRSGRYDLIVAADGIYSPLRDKLLGAQHAPRTTGQSVWRLTMPRPADMTRGVMMSAPHRKAGYIPLSPELMYLLLVTEEAPGRQFKRDELPGALRERLEGFGGLVAATRHHVTDDCDVVYRPLEVVMLPPPWHRGRVLFIGDAAHASTPHLGQGAAMAVEDAVVLGELMAAGTPASTLGEAFMARRYARATKIQTASFDIGEFEQGRRPGLDLQALLREARACAAEAV
jgi:2-polyprenyl-6-methoxyphenol hydroxylase-like FAD-dependent oxidoreductase